MFVWQPTAAPCFQSPFVLIFYFCFCVAFELFFIFGMHLVYIFIQEEFEDTKGATRNCKSKKERQYNGQNDKKQSTKHHTENQRSKITNPTKTGVELRYSGRIGSSCTTSGTRRITQATKSVISHEWGKEREMLTTSET